MSKMSELARQVEQIFNDGHNSALEKVQEIECNDCDSYENAIRFKNCSKKCSCFQKFEELKK